MILTKNTLTTKIGTNRHKNHNKFVDSERRRLYTKTHTKCISCKILCTCVRTIKYKKDKGTKEDEVEGGLQIFIIGRFNHFRRLLK